MIARCGRCLAADAVNTSARIAWLAHKLSHDILCTEEFKASLEAARSPAGATLVPAGSVTLKGKQTEVAIYAPDPGRTLDQSANLKRPSRFWDLPVCEALEETIAGFIYEALDKKAAGLKRRMLVIEAPPGAGKSFLLSFIQHEVVPSIVVELGHEPAICLRLHAVASNMPYGLCHQVLQKLLEMDGAPQAARFSRLEVRTAFSLWAGRPPGQH